MVESFIVVTAFAIGIIVGKLLNTPPKQIHISTPDQTTVESSEPTKTINIKPGVTAMTPESEADFYFRNSSTDRVWGQDD